jgi:DNA helicase-2/ATP-dependent DNA helicase PcrA
MSLLDELNEAQRRAVESLQGPLLVLAGAGSGKTRVITYRIAYLIERGTPESAILAVTFTNKAADEMRERVLALLRRSGRDAGELWISTFHSFCARFLRREAASLGLLPGFPIYDDADQASVVRDALRRTGRDEAGITPRELLERISRAKNSGISCEEFAATATSQRDRVTADVYRLYEETLRRAGGLDFDDLLLRAVDALGTRAEIREKWNRRFRYLLVDEYQDTNRAQYELVRLLAGPERNVCVVGDEDQSIYGWRGADVNNILNFAGDFPGAQVFRLEENYRSTQNVLDAALAVVSRNVKRLGKDLRATRSAGPLLRFFEARDPQAEAEFVAQQIFALQKENAAARIAAAYRTNAQSRPLEEALRHLDLRYRLVGGFSFFKREEIRVALAYLRVLLHPADDAALLRIINTPARGIGDRSVEALRGLAQQAGLSLWEAIGAQLERKPSAALHSFRSLIESLRAEMGGMTPAELLREALERTDYITLLAESENADDRGRAENLRELVNALAEHTERGQTLEEFLDEAALVSDADEYDERAPVTLLTLHSAKGLEFDHVFLCGMEEGVFPHARSLDSADALEEERRLCYVGMTRARETLTLTRAVYRRSYGDRAAAPSDASRFLNEIPGELIEAAPGSLAEPGQTRRYEPDPEYSYSEEEFRRRARGYAGEPPGRRAREPRLPRAPRGPASPLLGKKVRHPTYGSGTIIAVEGDEDDRRLTVSFVNHGTKKLVERYANLEPA